MPTAQPRLDSAGGVDLNVPVRLTLDPAHPTSVKVVYAKQTYILEPGIPTFVPYMAMCLYLGDPRAIDVPGGRDHEQYRRNEYARLRKHWGVYEHDDRWAQVPKITATPIDSDHPFNTVLADPEGANLSETVRQENQTKFLQDQMERMAQQMRVMQAQLAQAQQAEGALEEAGIMELDRQEATSRSVAPEQSMVGAHPQRREKSMVPKTRMPSSDGQPPAETIERDGATNAGPNG